MSGNISGKQGRPHAIENNGFSIGEIDDQAQCQAGMFHAVQQELQP